MILHRPHRKTQPLRYSVVGHPLKEKLRDLSLPRRQETDRLPGLFGRETAPRLLETLADGPDEFVRVDGLLQKVVGPLAQGLDGHVHVAVSRQKDDRRVDTSGDHLVLQTRAAHPGHAHVEHDDTGARGHVVHQKFFRTRIGDRVEPLLLEHVDQSIPNRGVVVDDADQGVFFLHFSHSLSGSRAGGSVTFTTRPPCGVRENSILPSCSSTRSRTIESPRPNPSGRVLSPI